MKKKTHIANKVYEVGDKAKYDTAVKNLLGDKTILAWIIHDTMNEFKEYSIEAIRECIEGEPEIGKVNVRPGETPEVITGSNTEDSVIGEGVLTYDIKFYIRTPDEERVKIIVNIEAQKNFYPGYNLVTRAIFYCARMLSSQLDKEFAIPQYDDIKKVYSIWICMDSPGYAKNTITKYSMKEEKIYGNFTGKARYDLLTVAMICLDAKEMTHDGKNVIGVLEILLSNKLSPEEKNYKLSKEYQIETSIEVKEELEEMCNLSDYIEEKAIEKGMEKGMEKGQLTILYSLMSDKIITLEEAAKRVGMTENEFLEAVKKYIQEEK